MEENVVLVTNDFSELGSMPKKLVHSAHTPLHKAFSCYIVNGQKQLLLCKRSESKKVWPGVWSNSVCGHPEPKEAFEDAIVRRANFELGATIKKITLIKKDYFYKTPEFNGIIEHEWCPIYYAQIQGPIMPNPDEVSNYRWVDTEDIATIISSDPDLYSYWFKDQQKHVNYAVLRYN